MLVIKQGSLFTSEAQTLVNPVNCVGVMGKGLAKEFKRRFPFMYQEYRLMCKSGLLNIGDLYLYCGREQWVLCFPTKRHYRDRSRLEDIETGLSSLTRVYKLWGIESLAMPALGCGEGGLEWADVLPLLQKHLGQLDIPVEIYEPLEA